MGLMVAPAWWANLLLPLPPLPADMVDMQIDVDIRIRHLFIIRVAYNEAKPTVLWRDQ